MADDDDFTAAETLLALPGVPVERGEPDTQPELTPPAELLPGFVDPLIGRSLGLFRVLQPIGSGSMGTVYLATHTVRGGQYAIKVLRTPREDTKARFHREARALLEVAHPNVVRIEDFGTTSDGRTFIVMEYVAGERLYDLMAREAPMPDARAAMLIAQVLEGLAAVHAAGFVHRDLKPANILVEARPEGPLLKLLDFGLAGLMATRMERTLTAEGFVVGSPGFMSPEAIVGQRPTHKADLYAAGAILYEMLTGRPPFEGDATTVMRQHVEAYPPTPPSALASVVMWLLHKDPQRRLEIADALSALR